MDSFIFVSVIMSVYGEKEEWLRKAIDSILAQTYSNFEFIIILDKPENEILWGVLKEYEGKDTRIILIKNDQNIGLAASLNKGIDISKGNYIVRMDGDDISLPKRIEILVAFMEQHQEIGVCGSWMKSFDGPLLQNKIVKYSTKHNELELSALYKTPIAHAPCIIRRNVIDSNLPLYNIKCCRSQDYELWSRLMNKGVIFSNIPKVLYMRRSSSNIGPQPIPYKVIHNQIVRNNIQQVLKMYNLIIPEQVTKKDLKILSNLLKNNINKKHNIKLSLILFLYYLSLDLSVINRMLLFLFSGDFLRCICNLNFKLLLRIFNKSSKNDLSLNNITSNLSLSIFNL